MSSIATNPFALCRYVPACAMLQNRQPSCGFGTDPLLRHLRRARSHEGTHRCIDEPRRVIVAVAAPGPVHEHLLRRTELRPPPARAQLVRERAEPPATLLLHGSRHGVVGSGHRARAW